MPHSPSRPFAAALWMSGSIAGFTALAISGRALGGHLDTFEMMLYRSAIGFVLVLAIALASGRRHEIGTEALGLHTLRNIIHFAGQNLWLYALPLIPLAQLFALEFSSPIVVALLAPFVIGEALTRTRVLVILVGFAGILIVARPFGAAALTPGLIAALLCAVCFGATALATKRLTRRVSVTAILFWLTLMQTVLGLVVAGYDGDIALPALPDLPWVFVLGISGIVAHLGLTKALSIAPATVVTPIDFLRLPIITVVGAMFYAEPPDLPVLIGGAIIFAANWVNILAENRRNKATSGFETVATPRH